MRSKKLKHTLHSRLRATERADGNMRDILNKLKHRKFVGLPRQGVNRRVAAMKLKDEWVVIVYSKSSGRIITVLTLEQYKRNHKIPKHIEEQMNEES